MLPHESPFANQGTRSMKGLVSKLKKVVCLAAHRHDHGCFPFFCRDPSCNEKGKCFCPPPDVPQGFLAVYAGRERKRFIIPASYLNHPAFRLLLEKVKEEFGFSQKGVLNMPFEVLLFEQFLWLVGQGDPAPKDVGVEELERYYEEKYHLHMETINLDD
ncbi:hypothetical protein KP509_18G042500 [Ceratopteris richardii]|uniref:Uncharacterized protein n=1 Tax=Ceratopteris richardii TaxID=49495 RepID=A0A8T2SR53_CERRI|nr:hypothetical protein KP509_18G042500 [Ceratopteris richardii]